MAHVRVSNGSAQASRCSAWVPPERTILRASSCSPLLIATAVWVALCGSTPMMTAMENLRGPYGWNRGGHSCFRSCARSSFEPHRGETPRDAPRSKARPGNPAGRHFESEPARASERYGSTTAPARSLKQALPGDAPCRYVRAFGDTPCRHGERPERSFWAATGPPTTGADAPSWALLASRRAGVRCACSVRPERHLGAMPHVDMSARSETVRAPFSCDLIRRYAALAPDSISGLVGASARPRPRCLGRGPARGGGARYGRPLCS